MKAKKYKPNVVYVVEIHGCQYYVGCHCWNRKLSENDILCSSGNPLRGYHKKRLITLQEYKECCKLVHIEEYDTREEALQREAELIQRFKEHYGNQCLNRSDGNKFGNKGVSLPKSEEHKKKLRDLNTNNPKQKCKPVRQFTLDGQFIKEYPSIHEAWRQTNIHLESISAAIHQRTGKHIRNGKVYYFSHRSAGGYLWESA